MAPRGLRNNNPGNIEDGPFAKSLPGYVGGDGRFATFASPAAGWNAIDALHQSYAKRGLDTVSGIITRWAPPKENDTAAYIGNVSRQMGVDPNARLDMTDPAVRQQLAQAQAAVENGPKQVADYIGYSGYTPGQPLRIGLTDPTKAPIAYGMGESPALGTPPVAPTPQGSPSPSPAPSSAPAGGGGLLGMITQALGITPPAQPAAGASGIPAQAPQGYPQQPSAPIPEEPPLQVAPLDRLQFATPQAQPPLLWRTRLPGLSTAPGPLRTTPYYPIVFGGGIRG